MKKNLLAVSILPILFSCSDKKQSEKPLNFEVIENKIYDIPVKSQISCRVYLTDSIYTEAQLKQLTNTIVNGCKQEKVKYHKSPTHIFVYVYAKKSDYEKNGASWVAMYEKINDEGSGLTIKK
jgi:hypothetical protein